MACDRFQSVPQGHIAAVVTVLEMRQAAPPRPAPADAPGVIETLAAPEPDAYLDLYRRVGAAHLWYSRLVMPVEALRETLSHREVEVRALMVEGRPEGLLEMDFRQPGACEIVYFGVTPTLVGTGAARVMMNHAIATAFGRRIDRLWLHTNTIDHPRALDFYQRSGFRPVERRIELAPDPRQSGLLPRDSAPHIPLL